MVDYFRLIVMASLPVLLTIIFAFLEKYSGFGKLPYAAKQLVIGVAYGLVAILATEFGVNVGGAVTNVRDAAPVCAGLFFGGPAGIVAGIIGGIERWFAVYWGAGYYTRLACTVSTIVAGFATAIIRKYLFKNKRASWSWSLLTAMVIEIFHMLMIFFTNMDDIAQAFVFVKLCSAPMIVLNSVSVLVAALFIRVIQSGEASKNVGKPTISKIFQRILMICLVVSFTVITGFIWVLQTKTVENNTLESLKLNINDVKNEVQKESDKNLLNITKRVAKSINEGNETTNEAMSNLCYYHDVSEVNLIRSDGIIIATSNPQNIGFDMWKGEQSSDFMKKIKGANEYVQQYQNIARDETVGMKYAGVILDNGYFIQVGYDGEKFRNDIDSQLEDITANRHIGQKGFVAICKDDVIVTDAFDHAGKTLEEIGLSLTDNQIRSKEIVNSFIGNEPIYVKCEEAEGFTIIAVSYADEVIIERDMSVYIIIFMEIMLMAILFVDIYVLLNRRVVGNVERINEGLSEITAGNLDVVLQVNDTKEFEELSDGINQTVSRLKQYIADEKARIDKDLEYAKTIQKAALPSVFPHYVRGKAFDLFTSMDAAKEVGGDFYDFYMLDKKHFVFLIADVSGKGIPAAMFMMTSKTQIRGLAEKKLSPAEIFTQANDAFCENNEAGMFVTAWIGILDIETGIVTYANAGHNPPVIKQNGEYSFFKTRPGLVLGGMEGIKYKQGELQLQPGDMIYLYTDGVTESTNMDNELFGDDRLLETLKALDGKQVEDIGAGVRAAVDAFAGEAPQFDDITMLVVKYKGEK